jgi:hypothetical protein
LSRKFLTPVGLPSGNTLPSVGSSGELFFKADEQTIYVHNGSAWVPADSGSTYYVSETSPENATPGDIWFNSATGKTFVYYDSFWIEPGQNNIGPIGPTGPTGPAGADGAAGSDGADGTDGADGADGEGFTWRGEWSSSPSPTAYSLNDVVEYQGSTYVCVSSSQPLSNMPPFGDSESPTPGPNSEWELMSAAGAAGEAGEDGTVYRPRGTWSSMGAGDMLGSYAVNDLVIYNGNVYLAKTLPLGTPGASMDYSWTLFVPKATGFNFRGEWSSTPTPLYTTNDIVSYDGSTWIGVSSSFGVSGTPGTSNSWVLFTSKGDGFNWLGGWNGSNSYSNSDLVIYNGSTYIVTDSTLINSSTPPDNNDGQGATQGWDLFVAKGDKGSNWYGEWSELNYAIDSVVSYEGSTYISKSDFPGIYAPTNTEHWGLVAAKGIDGDPGADGADGASLNWQGEWTGANGTTNDVVSYNGSTYIAIADSPGEPPTNTMYWDLLAAKGADGATGPTGPTGPAPAAPFTITQSSNNPDYPLTISSANEQGGGAGWSDMVKLVNSKSGATNPAKHIRMNATGGLEIVNNAYSSTIFSIADSGIVTSSNLGDTGWITVSSFSNGFTAPSTVAYRRLNNVVYLRGNLTGGTANTTAFTLPEGYRPVADAVFAVQQYGTANFTYITAQAGGAVVPNNTSGWLTGVVFPVG